MTSSALEIHHPKCTAKVQQRPSAHGIRHSVDLTENLQQFHDCGRVIVELIIQHDRELINHVPTRERSSRNRIHPVPHMYLCLGSRLS